MCMIINLCELLIVKCVVEVIEYFGYFYDGFLMQIGLGGVLFVVVCFLKEKMLC